MTLFNIYPPGLIMLKLTLRHLFTLTSLALTGTIGYGQPAQAFTISLDGSPVSGVYNYGITLDAGESVAAGEDLILFNLSNETDSSQITVTGSSFYNVITADSTSASLEAINYLAGANSFSPAFTITTTGFLDGGEYLAFSTQGVTPTSSLGSLPLSSSVAVTFESSPVLGLLLVGTLASFLHFRPKPK